MTDRTANVRALLAEYRAAKSDTAKARIVAKSVYLPTMAEVADFATTLRRESRIQDPSMLPEGPYFLQIRDRGGWNNEKDAPKTEIDRDHLLNDIETATAQSERVSIDWPSITFHWGVMVMYRIDGVDYRVTSADWSLTETYLSS